MAKKNTVVNETPVASVETPKTLAEKLDGACHSFLTAITNIMDDAMANTRQARDNMMSAVVAYREEVAKQDELSGVILSVGETIVHAGEKHIAEVETYENTLGILDDLDDEIASLDGEIVDEDDCDKDDDTDDDEVPDSE